MRVAFHYPGRCVGRPFETENLWDGRRGLTGSEVSFFRHAFELARRGHEVELRSRFSNEARIGMKGGVVRCVDDANVFANGGHAFVGYDVVVSWMSPEACRGLAERDGGRAFRVYVEQCCDHGNTPWAWEGDVDLFCTLSNTHAAHMARQNGVPAERCRIVPNGVDLEEFRPAEKRPGKVAWASSHDRGLHHLLEMWTRIKRAVPHATLDVFYDDGGMRAFAEMPAQEISWLEELRRRSVYELEALERLGRLDVRARGSVSRESIATELALAEVLAYPCDPVRRGVETFGSVVLESMAAGCLPVLCLSDAFDELWGKACPGVLPPFSKRRGPYEDLLIEVLRNERLRAGAVEVAREAARPYDWRVLGDRFERMLLSRGAEGFDRPRGEIDFPSSPSRELATWVGA